MAYGIERREEYVAGPVGQTTHTWALKQVMIESNGVSEAYDWNHCFALAKNAATERGIELLGIVRCDGQFPLRVVLGAESASNEPLRSPVNASGCPETNDDHPGVPL